MRLNTPLLSLAALSPLASAQNLTEGSDGAAPVSLATVDVIETFTTSFTGAQASLGNVTEYIPVPTVVPASFTSGLLVFSNATRAPSGTPIVIPAGNISYTISSAPVPTVEFIGGADRNAIGFAALLGAGVGAAALL